MNARLYQCNIIYLSILHVSSFIYKGTLVFTHSTFTQIHIEQAATSAVDRKQAVFVFKSHISALVLFYIPYFSSRVSKREAHDDIKNKIRRKQVNCLACSIMSTALLHGIQQTRHSFLTAEPLAL